MNRSFQSDRFSIRYQTWGQPEHTPILFFHGFPGSHLQAQARAPLVKEHRVFLIAADRPGYGETIGQGNPSDYLKDLKALLESLKVDRFHVLGVSGGSPWVHLMASQYSEYIASLTIVCGLAPFCSDTQKYFTDLQRKALNFVRWMPTSSIRLVINQFLRKFNPEEKLQQFANRLDISDQKTMLEPTNRALLLSSMGEARKQGAEGIVNDAKLYQTDWLRKHCDLDRLRSIPTSYYHGRRDLLLDHRMSQWMHETHGRSQLVLFDDEGHYSLAFNKADAILAKIR